jgi:alpha-tubulin suppressor-like RCC1 family protein
MGPFGSSYALDSDGYVWAWGNGERGKLGQGNQQDKPTPVQVLRGDMPAGAGAGAYLLHDIVAISAGNHHVLALDNEKKVWAWGKNYYGQLGTNDPGAANPYDRWVPAKVKKQDETQLTNIVFIDAGFEHSLAIDEDGNIWVWGRNTHAELGLGDIYEYQKYAKQMPLD